MNKHIFTHLTVAALLLGTTLTAQPRRGGPSQGRGQTRSQQVQPARPGRPGRSAATQKPDKPEPPHPAQENHALNVIA